MTMRPDDPVRGGPFECYECGNRTGSDGSRECPACGSRMRHLGTPRDL